MKTKHYSHAVVTDLGTEWFDLLAIRNEAPYGSAKYLNTEARMETIENKASMMVFKDTDHTMCECLNGHEDER